MSYTKELYQNSEPVSYEQLKDYRDFTKDRNDYPRLDKGYDQFWAEHYQQQELAEIERMELYHQERQEMIARYEKHLADKY